MVVVIDLTTGEELQEEKTETVEETVEAPLLPFPELGLQVVEVDCNEEISD